MTSHDRFTPDNSLINTNLEENTLNLLPTTIFTVSDLVAYIKEILESNPSLTDIQVTGEVSNNHRAASGHSYFSLRDESSVLRCVMFRSGVGHKFLSDGTQTLVHGRVSFYTARGDLQLYADSVTPEGLGALQQAFEELKRRLGAEGLFDPSRKRNLPKFPQRLALITSPDGSVMHDVLNVLRRRYPLVEVTVAPTAVQGAAAADGIVDALSVVDKHANFDVAIVTRGGGSLEDLWPFNEERVARAIYASRTPIISAVGHETDFTIADLVADARAPTPSTAAELVAPDQTEIATDIARMISRAALNVEHSFGERHVELELATDRLLTRSPNIVGGRNDVDELLRVARLAMNHFIERYKGQIEMLQTAISALGPEKILERGYAIVRLSESRQVVKDATSIIPGDQLNITLATGEIEATTKSSRHVRDA